MAWNQERLEQVAQTRLSGAKLIVVSNREPYINEFRNGKIECVRPAGGLTTALDPVMRACGGVWIAHGSGSADRQTSDEKGRLRVPPGDPSYTLRRVWLDERQEEGYYYGFSNSTLWPLCHQVYCKPTFDSAQWEIYKEVNEKFAAAVLEEAQDGPALVFVQDYHFALLPQMLKSARPDLVVAQFWHIPWPNPEIFCVCPWASELLAGMLGNDLMSFQIQNHCNNFLDTVDRTLECRIDRERFAVERQGHVTSVRPYPISVDPELVNDYLPINCDHQIAEFREQWDLGDLPLIVGVDRMDYTKGIPERLLAVDRMLEKFPEWKGKFHFLQVGAPSRTHLSAYRGLNEEVESLVERINAKHRSDDWNPIVFLNRHYGPEDVFLMYRMSAACVVSSLQDGMNLVAKEYVSCRGDDSGVLILSQFTGAARELKEALIVNPYDVDQMAEALNLALTMPLEEQKRRMRKMRLQIEDYNIYRWAGMLLSEVGKMAGEVTEPLSTASTNLDEEQISGLIARQTAIDTLALFSGMG